jgi:plasmid maintenance system antidote protein VapI
MKYTFDILGVSPVLLFFQQQQELIGKLPVSGVEYLGTPKCTLDGFINSVEPITSDRGWDLNEVVDAIVKFWMQHSETISYWKSRLQDAGSENLLVARVANLNGLQQELEFLLRKKL